MSSRSWFLKSVLWLVAGVVFLLLFVLPMIQSSFPEWIPPFIDEHSGKIQWLQLQTMNAFVYVWIFFLGSCFASFLNVVAWRVPRGKSLLGSSHCPHCDLKLSFIRDNVPIIGWLRNGGKCSGCKVPITVRYLVAELVLGFAFLALFVRELVSGGANLPFRTINHYAGIENVLLHPDWNLIAVFAFQLFLLASLFTFTMIASEQRRVPFSVFGFAAVAGVAILFNHLAVNLVDWRLVPATENSAYAVGKIDMAIAIAAGIVAGTAAATLVSVSAGLFKPSNRHQLNPGIPSVYASLVLVGIFLGWQTVVSVVAIYFVVSLCVFFLKLVDQSYRFVDISGRILLSTLLHLLCWRQQDTLAYWCSPSASLIGAISCAGGVILCAMVSAIAYSRFTEIQGKVDADSVRQ